MRKRRNLIISQLIRLYQTERSRQWTTVRDKGRRPRGNPAFVTIIPNSPSWTVPGPDLDQVSAKRLLNQFRADLIRKAGLPKDGWGFFALHCEYDEDNDLWHFHIHGMIAGSMIDRMEELRTRKHKFHVRKYLASTKTEDGVEWPTPIRISRNQPDDLFARATYILQSWWPCEVRFHPVTGARLAKARRKRIPEPRHAQSLVWLDGHSLDELVLLVGLRVQRQRLIRTGKVYTNGDRG